MQSLEEISSNQEKIANQVNMAIVNVSVELNQLSSEINMVNVFKVYNDVLKLLVNFPGVYDETVTSQLFTALVKIIRSDNFDQFRDDILVVLSVIIYQSLLNPKSHSAMVGILKSPDTSDIFSKFAAPKNDDGQILGINDLGFFQIFQDSRFNTNLLSACSKFIQVLGDFPTVSRQFDILNNSLVSELDLSVGNSDEPEPQTSLIKLTELLLNRSTRDVTAIMFINSPNLLETLFKISPSPMLSYTLEIIVGNLIEIFSCEYYTSFIKSRPILFNKIDNDTILKIPTLTTSNKNLEIAMKLILELLDHQLVDFQNLKTILIYFNWCLNQIISYAELPYGKLNVYTVFNKLKPKVSFVALLKLQTFQLVEVLNKSSQIQFPTKLVKHLNIFKLPPLYKSNCLLDDLRFVNEPDLVNNSTQDLLLNGIIKNLKLMSMFIQDDLSVDLLTVENNVDSELNQRIMFGKINSTLSCQLVTLLVIGKLTINPLSKDMINYFVVETLSNAIATEIKTSTSISSNLVLIHLLKFSKELSMADIRFVKIFNFLYDKLVCNGNEKYFNDSFVTSEIIHYLNIFGNDGMSSTNLFNFYGLNQSINLVTLNTEDYRKIYE